MSRSFISECLNIVLKLKSDCRKIHTSAKPWNLCCHNMTASVVIHKDITVSEISKDCNHRFLISEGFQPVCVFVESSEFLKFTVLLFQLKFQSISAAMSTALPSGLNSSVTPALHDRNKHFFARQGFLPNNHRKYIRMFFIENRCNIRFTPWYFPFHSATGFFQFLNPALPLTSAHSRPVWRFMFFFKTGF